MANTYHQIYIQVVFAVQGRHNIIREEFRDELEKYMCGTISNKKCKPIAIFCNPDHVHILLGLHPTIAVADLVKDIKTSATYFIKEKHFIKHEFNWQIGYGAFSYTKSDIDSVAKYILNQSNHHKKKTFKDEYIKLLKDFGIEFDEKYLFNWDD